MTTKITTLTALSMLAQITATAQDEKPNILLIISDDLNCAVGPYVELKNHTPNINRLASEGVTFSQAFCQYPVSGPSRASFMSGLYPERNKHLGYGSYGSYRKSNPELSDHPSMAGFFKEQGYYSARVSKIYHMGVPGDIENGHPGSDDPDSWDYAYNVHAPETLTKGTLTLHSPKRKHLGSSLASIAIDDEQIATQADYLATSQAIAILENRNAKKVEWATNKAKVKPDAPFFLAVGLVRPHVPLIAPKRHFDNYPLADINVPDSTMSSNVPSTAYNGYSNSSFGMNESQKREAIQAYYASVQFMDEQVGRLMETLDELNLRENTIVIFMSDHGYSLGEHNCWSKVSMWETSVRVPLIISHPDYKKSMGKTSESVVELLDLYPTLAEFAGYKDSVPSILQGESLVRNIENPKLVDKDDYAYIYNSQGSTIRTNRYRYTLWEDNKGEELYDLSKDPGETNNIALDGNYSKTILKFREKIEEIKEKNS